MNRQDSRHEAGTYEYYDSDFIERGQYGEVYRARN